MSPMHNNKQLDNQVDSQTLWCDSSVELTLSILRLFHRQNQSVGFVDDQSIRDDYESSQQT